MINTPFLLPNDILDKRKIIIVKFFFTKLQQRAETITNNKPFKPDFHLNIISLEILDSSNLIGFAQFSAKKFENISTYLISREIKQ